MLLQQDKLYVLAIVFYVKFIQEYVINNYYNNAHYSTFKTWG